MEVATRGQHLRSSAPGVGINLVHREKSAEWTLQGALTLDLLIDSILYTDLTYHQPDHRL